MLGSYSSYGKESSANVFSISFEFVKFIPPFAFFKALKLIEVVTQRCPVKRFSQKVVKIHRKTPVLESSFNKIAGCKSGTLLATLLKDDSSTGIVPVNSKKVLRINSGKLFQNFKY